MNYGFIRVGAATIKTMVGDITHNTNEIIYYARQANDENIQILVYPELTMTGYTCGDLFMQHALETGVQDQLDRLLEATADMDLILIIGAPISLKNGLYNCALILHKGQILGIQPKKYLPNYNEYYEKRWFASGFQLISDTYVYKGKTVPLATNFLFQHASLKEYTFGIEICEELWMPMPPSGPLALAGANLIFNPSASNDLVGKSDYRKSLVANQSARTMTAYIYASAGYGESSTDVVFGGQCLIYENGQRLASNQRFSLNGSLIYAEVDLERLAYERKKHVSYSDQNHLNKDVPQTLYFKQQIKDFPITRNFDPHPFVPADPAKRNERCEEIFNIQALGLAKRLEHIGQHKVVVGVSGGLDSTLALLVCTKTFDLLGIDRNNIIGLTMPGYGTTDRTYQNACQLIEELGCTFKEISIVRACDQHFADLGHDKETHDITYENTQARERTQILMNYANKIGGIVIGTGDLSELALGWATYNGDHMSMYGVNSSIPKTLVRYLVDWVASHQVTEKVKPTLLDILKTPVSPELLPPSLDGTIAQKTEEVVGPYELHDFFLYYVVRLGFSPSKIFVLANRAFDQYDPKTILKWLKTFYWRFFSQQFKRSCLPDGPKVGSINLSPRGDWRMPSDAVVTLWLEDLESINI